MKLLLTGSNSRQCGVARLNSKRIFDAWNLNQMLKTFADVDFMPATNSIDYSQYDAVIVGFGAMGSSTYPYLLQALYAIGKNDNCIIYLEDWKCPKSITSGLKSTYERGYDTFVKKVFNKSWSNGAKFYMGTDGKIDPETVWHGVEKAYTQAKSCKYLIPAFEWGDKKIVSDYLGTPRDNLLWFDETPYFIEQQDVKDMPYNPDRKRRFFYCGLSNQDSWLKKQKVMELTDCFGPSPYEKIATEAEVNQKHNEYLGIAIPEYYHAGSGWLRFRYIYGAMAKNVFMIGEKDANALGVTPVKQFDSLTDQQLEEIAMSTYEAVKKHIPTKEDACLKLKQQFNDALNIL